MTLEPTCEPCVIELQGACALVMAMAFPLNPPGNPYLSHPWASHIWKSAFDKQARRMLPADVSRATIVETKAPGRGRGCRGYRHEWSDREKVVAWVSQTALTRAEISALMPRHSPQAVRNQLHRMKQKLEQDNEH